MRGIVHVPWLTHASFIGPTLYIETVGRKKLAVGGQ